MWRWMCGLLLCTRCMWTPYSEMGTAVGATLLALDHGREGERRRA